MAYEDKAKPIQELMKRAANFPAAFAKVQGNTCACCGGPADHFDNALSQQEYGISRMCRRCQDEVFGG